MVKSFEHDAQSILNQAPPVPEVDFKSAEEMFSGAASAGIKLESWDLPLYPGLEEMEGIVFHKVGGIEIKMDIFRPENLEKSKPLPGILFIHGGGWLGMSRKDIRHLAMGMAQRGYVTASADYRLAGEAKYPAAVQDCVCALKWFRAHAKEYHVDPENIGVMGNSAGAHLALMVAYAGDEPPFQSPCAHEAATGVKAVVQLYGPTDLAGRHVAQLQEALVLFLGKSLQEAPERYAEASPLTYVTSDSPPTLIMHGTTDELVPVEQADLLAERLKETGVPYIYDRIQGWPHGMDACVAVRERLLYLMKAFFDRFLQPASDVRRANGSH